MNTNSWRIKSISVEGLLGQNNLFWELHSKVNILGGPNGSGKSTLLHALAVLLQGTMAEDIDKDEVGSHCEALFNSLKVILHSGERLGINRSSSSKSEVVEDEKESDVPKKREKITETISYKGIRATPANLKDPQFVQHVIYVNSSDLSLRKINRLFEQSTKTSRPALTTLDLLLEQAIHSRNQLFAQRMTLAMQEDNEDEVNKLRNLFGRFEEAVRHFMEEYLVLDTSKLLLSKKNDRERPIPYFHLSTGEKQLLYILLTVCNTLGESTILLLDEADLGMHIDWKKKLLRELLTVNPNMQIIAATHAPSLIEGWYNNVKEITQLLSSYEGKESTPGISHITNE